MPENIFIPKYGIAYRIVIPTAMLCSGLFLAILLFRVSEVTSVISAILSLLNCVIVLLYWIKSRFIKIEFQEDRIVFQRQFIRPLEFFYSELTSLGLTQLQFGKQKVALLMMENSNELVAKINGLIESGVISPVRFDGNTKASEFLGLKAGALSIVPILLVGLLLDWFLPKYFGINLDILFIFAVTSVAVVSVAYVLLKRSNLKENPLVKNEPHL